MFSKVSISPQMHNLIIPTSFTLLNINKIPLCSHTNMANGHFCHLCLFLKCQGVFRFFQSLDDHAALSANNIFFAASKKTFVRLLVTRLRYRLIISFPSCAKLGACSMSAFIKISPHCLIPPSTGCFFKNLHQLYVQIIFFFTFCQRLSLTVNINFPQRFQHIP